MRRVVAALVAIAASLLVSCSAAAPVTPPPTDGCAATPSQEAYQTGAWTCPDGSLVFTFATTGARDSWIQAATQYAGARVLDKGATWVKAKESG